MGLKDDIYTLTTKFEVDEEAGQELAEALAEVIGCKNSKRLIWGYFDNLADVMRKMGRYHELMDAADGVDPEALDTWDCQAAVETWLERSRTDEADGVRGRRV